MGGAATHKPASSEARPRRPAGTQRSRRHLKHLHHAEHELSPESQTGNGLPRDTFETPSWICNITPALGKQSGAFQKGPSWYPNTARPWLRPPAPRPPALCSAQPATAATTLPVPLAAKHGPGSGQDGGLHPDSGSRPAPTRASAGLANGPAQAALWEGTPAPGTPVGNDAGGQRPSQPHPNSLRPHRASPLPGAHVQAPPLLSDPSLSEIPSRPTFAQNLKTTKAIYRHGLRAAMITDCLLQRGSRSRTHTEPSGHHAPALGPASPCLGGGHTSVPAQPHCWLSQSLRLAVPRKRETQRRATRGPRTWTSVQQVYSQPSGFSPAEMTSFRSELFPS